MPGWLACQQTLVALWRRPGVVRSHACPCCRAGAPMPARHHHCTHPPGASTSSPPSTLRRRQQLLDQALGPADVSPVRPRLPPSVHKRLGEAASGAAAVSMTSLARRSPLLAMPDAWLGMLRPPPQGEGLQQSRAADASAAARLVKVRGLPWVSDHSGRGQGKGCAGQGRPARTQLLRACCQLCQAAAPARLRAPAGALPGPGHAAPAVRSVVRVPWGGRHSGIHGVRLLHLCPASVSTLHSQGHSKGVAWHGCNPACMERCGMASWCPGSPSRHRAGVNQVCGVG